MTDVDPGRRPSARAEQVVGKALVQLLAEEGELPETFQADLKTVKHARKMVEECAFLVALFETLVALN